MADYNSLGFAFVGLKTTQFATNDKAYRTTGELDLRTNIGFALDEANRILIVEVQFDFFKKKDAPFLKIALQGHFEIDAKGWKQLSDNNDNSIIFPQKLITHFVVLPIGAARGALHAKTEGSIYNTYILPTVNVAEVINKDVIFTSQGLVNEE